MKRKKLLGLFLFLVFITVYVFAVMLLAVHVLPDNRWVELIFYPIAGIVWIFPAKSLVRLMLPGDDSSQ
ncbi:DUF2842 domain-containing protein [Sneathiella limimaris]|uniref:DUF2842 domain-containing protein n=1 Tax=Sneathiella limimaris TaxID=1964213 RepID=UPI00146B6860|nr:DUF2842 domain-containing protein [Sneathiella limimaris]